MNRDIITAKKLWVTFENVLNSGEIKEIENNLK